MPQLPFKWPPVTQLVAAVCIIVFIAAILYPVFQKPREGNRRDYCRRNLKQLSIAFIQYSQDADENFPSGVNATGNGWAGRLYSFTRSTAVYQCPRDKQEDKFISYAENQNLVRQNWENLTKPAATVELYEFSTPSCDPSTPEAVSATGLSAPQDSTRHDPSTFGLNFLMTDGHVKWLLPAQVSGGMNAVSPKALPSGGFVQTFAVK